MAHDVPLGCAPDEYDDLISGTCSHLPYVIIAEIFPIHVRGIAVSIATFALWGGNFLVSRYFPVLVENISAANTFFIFSGISIIALFFVLTKVPETKGKTLEEIETELHRK
ncbi:MFS transporter [Raoultella ornithinolytica]|uniref:MFS transporter n=1 Tax=Raoultella ornithinolytica TaxID=54291 RepID=UPI001D18C46D|nr:MFS transporter [Raoultella ornithinolytica]